MTSQPEDVPPEPVPCWPLLPLEPAPQPLGPLGSMPEPVLPVVLPDLPEPDPQPEVPFTQPETIDV